MVLGVHTSQPWELEVCAQSSAQHQEMPFLFVPGASEWQKLRLATQGPRILVSVRTYGFREFGIMIRVLETLHFISAALCLNFACWSQDQVQQFELSGDDLLYVGT